MLAVQCAQAGRYVSVCASEIYNRDLLSVFPPDGYAARGQQKDGGGGHAAKHAAGGGHAAVCAAERYTGADGNNKLAEFTT